MYKGERIARPSRPGWTLPVIAALAVLLLAAGALAVLFLGQSAGQPPEPSTSAPSQPPSAAPTPEPTPEPTPTPPPDPAEELLAEMTLYKEEGTISQERLDESVLRVLRLKLEWGIIPAE